jgi:hypothetical protein
MVEKRPSVNTIHFPLLYLQPSKLAQAVVLLAFIPEVPGSKLGQDFFITVSEVFCGISQSLQANACFLP